MTAPALDVTQLPPAEMEQAYLEYRRACYDIVYRNCLERGVMDHFSGPVTFGDFVRKLPVASNKLGAAQLLLDALVKYGALERLGGDEVRYQAREAVPDPGLDEHLIEVATGKRSVQELRHAENYVGIINALSTAGNPVSASFDGQHLGIWDEVLQAPFYRYSRVQAVREITGNGNRMADFACGPGFGLAEIADGVPAGRGRTILGVEISPDFVAAASARNAADPDVYVMRSDLERPLSFLEPGYFDGAMIVGAYHFLRDKAVLWDTAQRLLRSGGVFCVAYVLSKMGTYDQQIMDLRFSLREPATYQPSRDDVLRLATGHGMTLRREFGLGAWRWYSFQKD
jgi:SAM-dependent methyltransferase